MTDIILDDDGLASYEALAASLESSFAQVNALHQSALSQGTTSKDQVGVFLTAALESHNLNPNAFTQRPTPTGLREYVASLESEQKSLLRRAIDAIAEFLQSIWAKIIDRLTGQGNKVAKAQAAIEQIAAQDEALEEAMSEIPDAKNAAPSPDTEERWDATLRNYTELTKLSLTNTKFSGALANLLKTLPANFEFLDRLIKDTIDQVQIPIDTQEQDFVDTQSMAMVRRAAIPSITRVNQMMEALGVHYSAMPLGPSDDPNVPDELAIVRSVDRNANSLHRALGELHETPGKVTGHADIKQMLRLIEHFQLVLVNYSSTLNAVKELSQLVLTEAKRFNQVAAPSNETKTNNKFDYVRVQAHFIKHASHLFKHIQSSGDLVVSDGSSFLFAVRSLKSKQLDDALKFGDATQRSAIHRKLSAKLEEIASKYK